MSAATAPAPRAGFWASLLAVFQPVAGGEIEVVIAENRRGGWSLYPANAAAARLFCGELVSEPGRDQWPLLEAGNFATYADARRCAVDDNCWAIAGEERA